MSICGSMIIKNCSTSIGEVSEMICCAPRGGAREGAGRKTEIPDEKKKQNPSVFEIRVRNNPKKSRKRENDYWRVHTQKKPWSLETSRLFCLSYLIGGFCFIETNHSPHLRNLLLRLHNLNYPRQSNHDHYCSNHDDEY
ncbi:hypothetical protein Dtox_4333 [Desulfofarcimen acetoxidans DSM 771]|uniref:Uncharacterized protein n=1 Tax=Desulfofarcimen acetoxidans (strain ATCC 49208 / DSM 771 / KCTC 5769 / VKM B-1644 / 5575) TaxID=485916 RepID=C8W029_DESAS|nr:hypothetical protein Dtox_4333 [Desulfofarcimen acetoxidans DSM 771]